MVEELHVPITVVVSLTPLPQAPGSRFQVERVTIAPALPPYDPLLHHIALVLQAAIEDESFAGQLSAKSLADVLVPPSPRWSEVTRQSPGEVTSRLSSYKLKHTIAYIKAHLAQELSLATLAAMEKTSPAHFAHLFKTAIGLAPHQYVIACRMEEAKRLLAETKDSLVDIGLQVGCADQSHFTALFHRHVGLTPKAYRDHTQREEIERVES